MVDKVKTEKMTNEQVERIEIAIRSAAPRNPFAASLQKALSLQADMDGKRKVITASYAYFYELMLFAQMAMDSTVAPDELERRLKDASHHP